MAAEKPVRLSVQAMIMSFTSRVPHAVQNAGPRIWHSRFRLPTCPILLVSLKVNDNGNVDGFLDDLAFTTHILMDSIHK